jgi:hypothetical protein
LAKRYGGRVSLLFAFIPATDVVPDRRVLQPRRLRDKGDVARGDPVVLGQVRATLEACSLLTDLAILEDGDQTEIGEKVRRTGLA